MSGATANAGGAVATGFLRNPVVQRLGWGVAGLGILALIWFIFGLYIERDPETASFAGFGLIPTLEAFPRMWDEGRIQNAVMISSYRLGVGLLIAIIIGIPVGILMGLSKRFSDLSNSPFQFTRMVSPLAWMPIAVFVFATWDGAIIFLITMAAVWPVMYATAAGLAKVDPAWFKVSRNLGASPMQMVKTVIMPAIAFDVLAGIRLALGVAWVVLVPAEMLGVTSGLGYAINDARGTLTYEYLTAMVVTIGVLGYTLDTSLAVLVKRYSWHKGSA